MLPTPVSLCSICVCPDNGMVASVCCFAKENISLIFSSSILRPTAVFVFVFVLASELLYSSILFMFRVVIYQYGCCCLFGVSSDKTTSCFAALWASPATCPLRWNIKDGSCIQTNGSLPAGSGSERCSQNIA